MLRNEVINQSIDQNQKVLMLQVQMNEDENKTYALKCLKKSHIVETKQEEHIMNEKRIMSEATSNFIVKLVEARQSQKPINFLDLGQYHQPNCALMNCIIVTDITYILYKP